MKIGHFSDAHLGYRAGKHKHPETGINLREQDGYDAFNEVIDSMIANKVDVVISSGDIFHSPTPSIYTIVKVQEGLQKLVNAGIPFYNIAGNHDATDNTRDIPSNRVLHNPFNQLYSFVEPYVVRNIGDNIYLHLISHHGYMEQEETMKLVKPIQNAFNILVTHGSCFDSEINGVLHTENSPREIVIPEYIMNMNWDYTLLGHIHERGWIASKDKKTDTSGRKQFYGGSLIRRGFADKESKLGRGWTLWEVNNNQMTPKFFNCKQRTQLDILLFCKDKSAEEITNELLSKFDSINFEEAPIIRATFIDLSSNVNTQLDWKKMLEKTSQCLSFSTKIKTKEEFKKELESYNYSFDLLSSYNEFWNLISDTFDEELKESIHKMTKELLSKGQELGVK